MLLLDVIHFRKIHVQTADKIKNQTVEMKDEANINNDDSKDEMQHISKYSNLSILVVFVYLLCDFYCRVVALVFAFF